MTPAELVDGLTEIGPEDRVVLSTLLWYLGNRVPDAVLTNGERLNDGPAFSEWLIEVAQELRVHHG